MFSLHTGCLLRRQGAYCTDQITTVQLGCLLHRQNKLYRHKSHNAYHTDRIFTIKPMMLPVQTGRLQSVRRDTTSRWSLYLPSTVTSAQGSKWSTHTGGKRVTSSGLTSSSPAFLNCIYPMISLFWSLVTVSHFSHSGKKRYVLQFLKSIANILIMMICLTLYYHLWLKDGLQMQWETLLWTKILLNKSMALGLYAG